MKGKFIVIYGANNLGKTLQVGMLEKALKDKGLRVKRIKYPLYDLKPTGPLINSVLRKGVQMEEEELQRTYVQNRRDYEKTLKQDLENGVWVIAEDYLGTGISWGMVRGLSLKFLEEINRDLYPEDVAFVFYGKRFSTGREEGHRNETSDEIWQKAYDNHMALSERYGWQKIFANRTPDQVHKEIMEILKQKNMIPAS